MSSRSGLVVLRLGRRQTAWEKADSRAIAAIEFQDTATGGIDLRPSVYLLEASSSEECRKLAVRARAEHVASFLTPPPRTALDFDLTQLGPEPTASEAPTKFAFTRTAHAELLLATEDQVIAIVDALRRERSERGIQTTADQLLAFIIDRVRAGDPEWIAITGPYGAETGAWGKTLRSFRKRSAESD